ncbi:hypothetical protein ALC53_10022 [Atta colombica]|uniref:Uncharacterized protein n=1 Tax=Atta colombica TaxID=520822 RepID=A0A195B504_9HYME|nr:hypothetical protein ALC53_10022 [Atta colombica]
MKHSDVRYTCLYVSKYSGATTPGVPKTTGVASGRARDRTRERRVREIENYTETGVERSTDGLRWRTTFRCPIRKPLRRVHVGNVRTRNPPLLDGPCPLLSTAARARATATTKVTATIFTVLVAASRLSKLGSNTRVAGCRLSDGRTRGAAAPCVGGGGDGGVGGGKPSYPPCRDAPINIPTSRAARLVVRAAGPTIATVVAPVYTPSGTITTYRTLLGILYVTGVCLGVA